MILDKTPDSDYDTHHGRPAENVFLQSAFLVNRVLLTDNLKRDRVALHHHAEKTKGYSEYEKKHSYLHSGKTA